MLFTPELMRAAAADLNEADRAAENGIAIASLNLPLSAGARVIVMEREHPSQHYEWLRAAEVAGAAVEAIARPTDDDWTAAILARLRDSGKPRVAIAETARPQGTALVLDGTQAIGAVASDVRQVRLDFPVFATYKWLLGRMCPRSKPAARKQQAARRAGG